jgi:hypothetical protein
MGSQVFVGWFWRGGILCGGLPLPWSGGVFSLTWRGGKNSVFAAIFVCPATGFMVLDKLMLTVSLRFE